MKYDEREFFANLLLKSIKTGRNIQYSMNGKVWNTFSKEKVFMFDSSPEFYRLEPRVGKYSVAMHATPNFNVRFSFMSCASGQYENEYLRTKQVCEASSDFIKWVELDKEFPLDTP